MNNANHDAHAVFVFLQRVYVAQTVHRALKETYLPEEITQVKSASHRFSESPKFSRARTQLHMLGRQNLAYCIDIQNQNQKNIVFCNLYYGFIMF